MLQSLFLQELQYPFQSCKFCSPFLFFRAASSPKKLLQFSTDTAWFETGRRRWRHTQVRAAFAHTLHLLLGFQSWFLRLSQGVCHHFSSEAQQDIPNNTSFATGKKVSFLPKVLVVKSQQSETVCVRAQTGKIKPNQTKPSVNK